MYVIIKALHITAVIVWIGTMAVAPLLRHRTPAPLRASIRGLMSVGLIATWLAGLSLATSAGVLSTQWLRAKLLLVLLLSAWHGVMAGQLRRDDAPAAGAKARASWVPTALLMSIVLVIVLLVILKPSL